MKPLKKVEIVVGKKETRLVIRILEKHNLAQFTIIKNASGRGDTWSVMVLGSLMFFKTITSL